MKKSIYLDSATRPLTRPAAVGLRMQDAVNETYLDLHPSDILKNREKMIRETKKLLAELFYAPDSYEVCFAQDPYHAAKLAVGLFGHDAMPAITTVMEHQYILKALMHRRINGKAGRNGNIRADSGFLIAELQKDGLPDYTSIREAAMRKRPAMIIVSQASCVTGDRIDFKRISSIAKACGAAVIADATITGGILELNMTKDGIDAVIFSGDHGFMGPEGVAGVIFDRSRVPVKLQEPDADYRLPRALQHLCMNEEESTVVNYPGIAGFNAGLRYTRLKGVPHVCAATQLLARLFYDGVRDIPGVTVYGNFEDYRRAPIVALMIEPLTSYEASKMLFEGFGIKVAAGTYGAPLQMMAMGLRDRGVLRFSFSVDNTEEEVKDAINAVRTIAESIREQSATPEA